MKKLLLVISILCMLVICVGCKSDLTNNGSTSSLTSNKQINSPEEVAATNVESWFEHDFEAMLKTYPAFRLKKRASYYVDESTDKTDIKAVAEAMLLEYTDNAREVEILSSQLLERQDFTDYSIYNELKEEYYDLTLDEFKTITETAVVKVNYALEDVVLEQEIKCIKMDNTWYVLEDGAFSN